MKKRNLLLLVCIMLAVVLTFVSCGNKGDETDTHEHTFDFTKYVSDATGHWYGATCEHSTLKLNAAEHADLDKNGVCDTCAYVTCTHTYDEDEWASDENNHWHDASCGCEVTKDVAAHIDEDKDGVCDTCAYVTCDHPVADEWSSDENGHWHDYTCDCELTPEVSAHADANVDGKCDDCEYVICAEHTFESTMSSTADLHWYESTCGCDIKKDEGEHVDLDKNGVCDSCSYAICAEHQYADVWSKNETTHWYASICGCDLKKDEAAHVDEDGNEICDVCFYDGGHVHTFNIVNNTAVWSWDVDVNGKAIEGGTHYLSTLCGCKVIANQSEHTDANNDAVCDVCGAQWCDHTYSDEWSMDYMEKWAQDIVDYYYDYTIYDYVYVYGDPYFTGSYGYHWHESTCGHDVISSKAQHVDANFDGVCDVCSLYDEDHEHEYELVYDKNNHYYKGTCHSVIKDVSAHADEDEDGYCDTCGAYVGGLEDIVDAATSADNSAKVNGGTYTSNDKVTEFYFGDGYIVIKDDFSDTYISTFTNKDGVKTLFKVIVNYQFEYNFDIEANELVLDEDGNKIISSIERDTYATDLSLVNGIAFNVNYTIEGVGTENFVYALYSYATSGENTVYGYTESYDAENGVFGFSYAYGSYYLYTVDVECTLTDGVITSVAIDLATYEDGAFFIDEATNSVLYAYNVEPVSTVTETIEQTVGEKTTEANPYPADDYLVSELQFVVSTDTEVTVTDGSSITIKPGYANGLTLNLTNDDLGAFNIFTVVTTANKGWSNYPVFVYANDKGSYSVTISNELDSMTFTLVVEYDAPTSIEAGVAVDNYGTISINPTESVDVYEGIQLTIGVAPNSNTASPYTSAAVTGGNADAVTLTANGKYWSFSASEVGTYVITLTSDKASDVTDTITINVLEAPDVSDVLNGEHTYYESYDAIISVVFTPDSEGATTGTVVIDFSDWYGENTIKETATYEYADGQIVLTHVEGDGLDSIDGITLNADFTLSLVICPYPMMPSYTLDYTLEQQAAEEEPAEPDGTQENPYVITGTTDIDVTVADGSTTYYTFTPTADGTLTITVNGGYQPWNINYGTNGFGLLDMMFSSPTTVNVTADTMLYLSFSAFEDGEYNVTLTYTPAGEDSGEEEVEAVAAEWSTDIYNPTYITESGTYTITVEEGVKEYFAIAYDTLGTEATLVTVSIDGNVLYTAHPMTGEAAIPVTTDTQNVDVQTNVLMYAVGGTDGAAATITVTITLSEGTPLEM